jgi:sensor domain CHASE-containing protein
MKLYNNFLPIIIISSIGILLSFTAFLIVQNLESEQLREKMQDSFEKIAINHKQNIKSLIYKRLEILPLIAKLYNNKNVTQQEFLTFIKPFMDSYSGIYSLAWMSKNNDIVYNVSDNINSNNFDYVNFIKEIELARDTGRPIVSNWLNLSSASDIYDPIFLVFQPVYSQKAKTIRQRRAYLKGYIVGTFRVKNILNENFKEQNIKFTIRLSGSNNLTSTKNIYIYIIII